MRRAVCQRQLSLLFLEKLTALLVLLNLDSQNINFQYFVYAYGIFRNEYLARVTSVVGDVTCDVRMLT